MWESTLALVSTLVALGTTLDELDFLRKHAVMVARKSAQAVRQGSYRSTRENRRHIVQYKVWGPESKI